MKNQDGTFGLKYTYVRDIQTGEFVTLPKPDDVVGRIDESAVTYNPDLHKNHLTCADCERPAMIFIAGYDQAGSKIPVRAHFKLAHDQHHAANCAFELSGEDAASSDREINLAKGPVIFLNGLPERMTMTRKFYRAARHVPKLVTRDTDGKLHVEGYDDRRRLRINTPQDMFRIMASKTMNRQLLNDAVIVNADKAIPWPRFFIRPGKGSETPFHRHIELIGDMLAKPQGKHAVLFNFTTDKAAEPVYKKPGRPETAAEFRLVGSSEADPSRREVERHRVALKHITMVHPLTKQKITVQPLVHIKNPALYDEFSRPGEFFILTQPYLNPQRGNDKLFFLNFEIHSPEHVVRHSLGELTQAVIRRPDFMMPGQGSGPETIANRPG